MASKFKKGDRVIVKRTGLSGTVEICCGGNIFLPEWLSSHAYYVRINGASDPVYFKQRQLKAYK